MRVYSLLNCVGVQKKNQTKRKNKHKTVPIYTYLTFYNFRIYWLLCYILTDLVVIVFFFVYYLFFGFHPELVSRISVSCVLIIFGSLSETPVSISTANMDDVSSSLCIQMDTSLDLEDDEESMNSYFTWKQIEACPDSMTRLHLIGILVTCQYGYHKTKLVIVRSKMTASDYETFNIIMANFETPSLQQEIVRSGMYGILLLQRFFQLKLKVSDSLVCAVCSTLASRGKLGDLQLFYKHFGSCMTSSVVSDSVWTCGEVNDLWFALPALQWHILQPIEVLEQLSSNPTLNERLSIESLRRLYDCVHKYCVRHEFTVRLFDVMLKHLCLTFDHKGSAIDSLLHSVGSRLTLANCNVYANRAVSHVAKAMSSWVFCDNAAEVYRRMFNTTANTVAFIASLESLIAVCLDSNATKLGVRLLTCWTRKHGYSIPQFWNTFDHRHLIMGVLHSQEPYFTHRWTADAVLLGCLKWKDDDAFLHVFAALCAAHVHIDSFLERPDVQKVLYRRYGRRYVSNQLLIDAVLKASHVSYVLDMMKRLIHIRPYHDQPEFFKPACILKAHITHVFHHGMVDVIVLWQQHELVHPLCRVYTSDTLSLLLKHQPLHITLKWLPLWTRVMSPTVTPSLPTTPVQDDDDDDDATAQYGQLYIPFVSILNEAVQVTSHSCMLSLLTQPCRLSGSGINTQGKLRCIQRIRNILVHFIDLCLDTKPSFMSNASETRNEHTKIAAFIRKRLGHVTQSPLEKLLLKIVVFHLVHISFGQHSLGSQCLLQQMLSLMYCDVIQDFKNMFTVVDNFVRLCQSILPWLSNDMIFTLLREQPELRPILQRCIMWYTSQKVTPAEMSRIKELNAMVKKFKTKASIPQYTVKSHF